MTQGATDIQKLDRTVSVAPMMGGRIGMTAISCA